MLSDYFTGTAFKTTISDDVVAAVRSAVIALNLSASGFSPDMVGSHSLRSGGAMAMKLNGIDRDTIRKIGRWSSDTFLMYIHEQIAHLSSGVSRAMANPVPFINIAGPGTEDAGS